MTPDPDATVRHAIVTSPRPTSNLFARRLLWSAVNDPSERVREESYAALLDSQFTDLRDQAMSGVRDDSVFIRLSLLNRMTQNPQAHYRQALRMAIIDSSPHVRAATLRAFAAQPGDVVLGEIQNVLQDKHPKVVAALNDLANAKGLTLPPKL
jgi:hypothetical protein